jgi:hypothetical protein
MRWSMAERFESPDVDSESESAARDRAGHWWRCR